MIKSRNLNENEKTFGIVERGLTIRNTVLKEFNPIKTSESDLEDMKRFYCQIPLVEVMDNCDIIGVVEWNNNIGTRYFEETIEESVGITQLVDGRFVSIWYNYGIFNAKVIPKDEAFKILLEAEILDKFLKY